MTCGVVGPPPGLDPFTRPAAHVEIDYGKFVFNLTDKDIFTTYCDASCTACPSTREATSGTDTTYHDVASMAGAWFSLSDPIDDGDSGNQGGDSDQSFHAAADSCDQGFAATANYYESGSLVFPPISDDPIEDSVFWQSGW